MYFPCISIAFVTVHCAAHGFRALTILPRRKHVATIIKFAVFEFKLCNSPELGRTIFDGLISSDPKRIDIWNVYIDQEVSAGMHKSYRQT